MPESGCIVGGPSGRVSGASSRHPSSEQRYISHHSSANSLHKPPVHHPSMEDLHKHDLHHPSLEDLNKHEVLHPSLEDLNKQDVHHPSLEDLHKHANTTENDTLADISSIQGTYHHDISCHNSCNIPSVSLTLCKDVRRVSLVSAPSTDAIFCSTTELSDQPVTCSLDHLQVGHPALLKAGHPALLKTGNMLRDRTASDFVIAMNNGYVKQPRSGGVRRATSVLVGGWDSADLRGRGDVDVSRDIVHIDDGTGLTTSVLSVARQAVERQKSYEENRDKLMSISDEDDRVKDSVGGDGGACQGRCMKLFPCVNCSRTSGGRGVEGARSWLILLAVFCYNGLSAINITGFSVLYVEISNQFNASKAAVGWLPGIKFFVACIVGIFVSHPINQYGCRLSAALGSLIVSVAIAASSLSPNLLTMCLLYGVLAGIGHSMAGLSQSVIIQQRFNVNRGLATGISTLGFTVGNFAGAPLTSWLLHMYGLRGCLLMIAGIMAQRIPLGLVFYTPKNLIQSKIQDSRIERVNAPFNICNSITSHLISTLDNHEEVEQSEGEEPHDVTQRHETDDVTTRHVTRAEKLKSYLRNSLDFTLFKDIGFTLFCLAGFLQKFYLHAFMNHMVNYCKHLGFSTDNAVWSLSVIGISAFIFRFIVTLLSNSHYIKRLLLYAVGLLFGCVAFIIIQIIPGTSGPAISAAVFGLQTAMTNTIVTVVLVDLLGVSNIARCLALYNLTVAFGFLTGSSFVGWLYDMQNSYTAAYSILAVIGFVAACLVFVVYIIDKRKHRAENKKQLQQLLEPKPDELIAKKSGS